MLIPPLEKKEEKTISQLIYCCIQEFNVPLDWPDDVTRRIHCPIDGSPQHLALLEELIFTFNVKKTL